MLQKIIASLKAAKVPYSTEEAGFLGVELTENNWSWFTVNGKGKLTFDHTFSQTTGRSKKSSRGRAIKEKAMARVLGFNPIA